MNAQQPAEPLGSTSTSNHFSSSSAADQKVDSNSHTLPTWTPSELATLQEAHFNDAPPSYEASGVPRYERYPRPLPFTGRDGQQTQPTSNMGHINPDTQAQPSLQLLAAIRRRKKMNMLLWAIIIVIMLAGFAALAEKCGGADRSCWG